MASNEITSRTDEMIEIWCSPFLSHTQVVTRTVILETLSAIPAPSLTPF
jgi:hypothetical protein